MFFVRARVETVHQKVRRRAWSVETRVSGATRAPSLFSSASLKRPDSRARSAASDLLHHRVDGVAVLHVELRGRREGAGQIFKRHDARRWFCLADVGVGHPDSWHLSRRDSRAGARWGRLARGAGRGTYVLRGVGGVDSRAVEQEAHGVGLQRLARAEGVEDLAGRKRERRSRRSARCSTVVSLGRVVEG